MLPAMWEEFLKLVLPGVGLTGLVVGVIVALSKKFLEQQLQKDLQAAQHGLDLKLAGIESELTRMRDRQQVMLATLQPRRADKLSEFAFSLSEYMESANSLVSRFYLISSNQEAEAEKAEKDEYDKFTALRTALRKTWLFIPHSLGKEIRKFMFEVHGTCVKAMLHKADHKKAEEIWSKYREETFNRHQALEEEFRMLLGVEAFEDLPADPANVKAPDTTREGRG
jgi:hypothetical protein